jgi:eukaryotic-like serine/threonine-protein kinase
MSPSSSQEQPRVSTLPLGIEGTARQPGPNVTELSSGTMLGEYRIEGLVAHGGMSSVYCAVHPLIGKKAAIKVMSVELFNEVAAVEHFIQEARAVNQIRHPNIVDVFSFGRTPDGRSYFAMEWLEGETLADRLDAGRQSIGECYEILLQVCDALEAAHAQRIAHLDLKPENVYLVSLRGGRTMVKLLDFGIAKVMSGEAGRRRTASAPRFNGTPEYASPEQAQGLGTIDERSDAYSLGVMAYEMFAGQRPFDSDSIVQLLLKHIHQAPPKPSTFVPHLPVAVERLLGDLLEKDPARRPTIASVHERLRNLRDQSLLTATHSMPCPEPAAPQRRVLVGHAAAILATLLLTAGAWSFERRSSASAARPVSVGQSELARPIVSPPPAEPSSPTPTMQASAPARAKHSHRHKSKKVAAATPRRSVPLVIAAERDYVIDYLGRRR